MPIVQSLIEVGNRIKKLRGKHTRAVFAEQFLVPPSTLARWETGESQPDLGFLVRLSGAFGVTIEWLVTGNENEPENGEYLADHKLAFLDKIDWVQASALIPSKGSDNENGRHVAHFKNTIDGQAIDVINLRKTDVQKEVRHVAHSDLQQENAALNKELRDLLRENATILRENGDLRVDVERKKARIAELERELARVLKGEEATPLAGAG